MRNLRNCFRPAARPAVAALLLLGTILASGNTAQAAGELDPAHATAGQLVEIFPGTQNSGLRAMTRQADGRIVVANKGFQGAGPNVARLNPDGTLDRTFGNGLGRVDTTINRIAAVLVQADGRIVVAGDTDNFLNPANEKFRLERYLPDGTRDNSFGPFSNGISDVSTGARAEAALLDASGRIVVAGGRTDIVVARLLANGTLDGSFGLSASGLEGFDAGSATETALAITRAPDGSLFVAGSTGTSYAIIKLTAGGLRDTTFDGDGLVTGTAPGATESSATGIAIDSAMRPVVGVSGQSGTAAAHAIRHLATGALDTTFATGGIFTVAGGIGPRVLVQTDGRIVLATTKDAAAPVVARLDASGAPDTSLCGGCPSGTREYALGSFEVNALETDGSFLFLGGARTRVIESVSTVDAGVAKLAVANGDPDAGFGAGGTAFHYIAGTSVGAQDLAVQADGKAVIAAGDRVLRFGTDGLPDATFGTGGVVTRQNGSIGDFSTVAVGSDGKVYAFGRPSFTRGAIGLGARGYGERWSAAGDFEQAYQIIGTDTDGFDVADLAIADGGVAYVAGTYRTSGDTNSHRAFVAKLLPGGLPDPAFGGGTGRILVPNAILGATNGVALAHVAGKLYLSGWSRTGSLSRKLFVARINASDGTLDATFDGDGIVQRDYPSGALATSIAITPEGNVIQGGCSNSGVFPATGYLLRYDATGAPLPWESSASVELSLPATGCIGALGLQASGTIVFGTDSGLVGKFLPGGNPLPGFGVDGLLASPFAPVVPQVRSLSVLPDGGIVFAGRVTPQFLEADIGAHWVARMLPDDTVPDAFGFATLDDADLALTATSNAVTLSGLGVAAPISVAGGEYSIGCTADFTAAPGFIGEGQSVCVRHVTAAAFSTATVTTLTVGATPVTFTSVTVPANQAPDAFSFAPANGVQLSATVTSAAATIGGIDTGSTTIRVMNGTYSIGCAGPYASAPGTIANGQSVCVRHVSSGDFTTAVTTTLVVGGVAAQFTSTTGALDDEADPLVIADLSGVPRNSTVEVGPLVLTGINVPVYVYFGNGDVAANCDGIWGGAVELVNGQSFCLRVYTPEAGGATIPVQVFAGNYAIGLFQVTTIDDEPDFPLFPSKNLVARSTLVVSDPVAITGFSAPATITGTDDIPSSFPIPGPNTGEHCVSSGNNCACDVLPFTSASGGTVSPGQFMCLRHVSSPSVGTQTNTHVRLGGAGALFSTTTRDDIPAAFSVAPLTNQPIATMVVSPPVTITGIDVAVPVTVTGGEYSVGCTASFTADPGAISGGQALCLRHVTSSSGFGQATTTVTVGGSPGALSASFVTTTVFGDTSPDAFSFVDLPGVPRSAVQVSAPVQVVGINVPAPISAAGGEYCISSSANCNCDVRAFGTAAAMVSPNRFVCARHTSAAAFNETVNTVVTVSGVSDTFSSTTGNAAALSFSPSGFAFGDQPVQTQSAAQSFTLANAGGSDAQVTSIAASGDFVVTGGTCPSGASTLVPGTSCTVLVAFRPLQLGPRGGSVNASASNVPGPGATVTLTGTGTSSDTTPNAFSFADQFLVAVDTVVTSAPVQITGLSAPAPVTVVGGTYALSSASSCSGDVQGFTANPGSVANNQFVCVRHTSSGVPGGANDTQLIVGGLGDTFTTVTADPVPAPFSFPVAAKATPGTQQVSAAVGISGINMASAFTVAGGEVSVNCSGNFVTSGEVLPGQSLCARHVAASGVLQQVETVVTVGGVPGSFQSTTRVAVQGDASGEGRADLFWREDAPGIGLSWWTMDGAAATAANFHQLGSEWQVADVGDLDGDGKADLLWRRTTDGASYLWTLDGLGFKGFFDLGILDPSAWSLVGSADLDGNGKSDIVWRNSDGTVYGWLMDGGVIVGQGVVSNPGTQWVIADLADMNGDGTADIVFRNVSDGGVYVYFMNGLAIASGGYVGAIDPVAWMLVGAADFDGDGKSDFLWRHTSGDTWVWLMDGAVFQSAGGIGNPGAGWSVRSFADLDGDGRTDLVWRHTDGTTYLWTMNGAAVSAFLPVVNPGGAWQVVAP